MYVGTSYLVCSYERRYVGALGIGESGLVGVGRGWLLRLYLHSNRGYVRIKDTGTEGPTVRCSRKGSGS